MSETIKRPTLCNGPTDAAVTVILAHGAGAPMDTDFMNFFAEKLASSGIRVIRFEFPYMALRREGHGKRPPNGQKILLTSWRQIINDNRKGSKSRLFIGGKSMGGRMASMIADEMAVDGLICLGYPFYAPGKMDNPRIEHLREIRTPTLILQGERDPMGTREIVGRFSLSSNITINWLADGNHDLAPRKKSGLTHQGHLKQALKSISHFIRSTQKN